jgi:predicted transcriptional regulator of viral defense system
MDPEKYTADPYLLATKSADDAVVAYHAALQYYGKTYSIWHRFHYLIKGRTRPFRFRNSEFVAIQMPASLRVLSDAGGGIVEKPRLGGAVQVTTFERTMVDVLDRPELSGGWEEIWRSLEMVEFFDLDAVISYALKLGSALTAARVGFYLEQHREQLMVEECHLESLQAHRPKQPRYMGPRKQSGKFFPNWNLVVPEYILKRSWEEVL